MFLNVSHYTNEEIFSKKVNVGEPWAVMLQAIAVQRMRVKISYNL